MDFNGLRAEIEANQTITLFRHLNPDCDAAGAQFALKTWILDNWPDKKVYALGTQKCTQGFWPENDTAELSVIERSLAVVLDCSNVERIDDDRWQKARKTVKIDHHPDVTPYGDLMYVDPISAATCEILAEFFRSQQDLTVSTLAASCAYKGILTDTLSFGTSNTTANTLQCAGYLAGFGIDIPGLNRELFDQTLDEFSFAGYIRSNIMIKDNKMAFIILDHDLLAEHHIAARLARNFIDEIGHVREFEIWCIFTEEFKEGRYQWDGSLRSKSIQVNDLARKYNGGGHFNASGVNHLSYEQVQSLIQELFERI